MFFFFYLLMSLIAPNIEKELKASHTHTETEKKKWEKEELIAALRMGNNTFS